MSIEIIVLAFAGGVFLLLSAVLSWIGSRLHNRIDDLTVMLDAKLTLLNTSLGSIERDLRQDLTRLDRRIAFIEGAGDSR